MWNVCKLTCGPALTDGYGWDPTQGLVYSINLDALTMTFSPEIAPLLSMRWRIGRRLIGSTYHKRLTRIDSFECSRTRDIFLGLRIS